MDRLAKFVSVNAGRFRQIFNEAMQVAAQVLTADLYDWRVLWSKTGDPEAYKLVVVIPINLNVAKQFLRAVYLFNFFVTWSKPNLLISQFSDRITFVIGVHNLLSLLPRASRQITSRLTQKFFVLHPLSECVSRSS